MEVLSVQLCIGFGEARMVARVGQMGELPLAKVWLDGNSSLGPEH